MRIIQYRKRFLAGCCICGLLMAACGSNASKSTDGIPPVSAQKQSDAAAAESGLPAAESAEAESEKAAIQERPAKAGSGKAAAQEHPAETGVHKTAADTESKQFRWTILDEQGIHAEYLCGVNYRSGSRCDVFRVSSRAEDNLIFRISDIRLNGDICTDAEVFVSTEPGSEADSQADALTQAVLIAERDGITLETISGLAQIYSWEWDENGNEKLLAEKPFEISIPENYEPDLICEPAYDMLAEEQVLSDENGINISLTGCGGYYGALDGISGILSIENHSGKEIPYRISAAEVNGQTVEIYTEGTGAGNLPEGALRYFDFQISKTVLEEAGITSVASMQLQILTDAEQDTGVMMRSAGGSWYPVTLAQHGALQDVFEPGELIYEDEWIQMGYIGTHIDWYPEDEFQEEAYGYCSWNLAVVNKTDENIELFLADPEVDGVPADDDKKPYFKTDEIGAHAKRNTSAFLRTEENRIPEISFRIQVRRQGGGALLNYAEDVVTITPDETLEQ